MPDSFLSETLKVLLADFLVLHAEHRQKVFLPVIRPLLHLAKVVDQPFELSAAHMELLCAVLKIAHQARTFGNLAQGAL